MDYIPAQSPGQGDIGCFRCPLSAERCPGNKDIRDEQKLSLERKHFHAGEMQAVMREQDKAACMSAGSVKA